VAQCGQTWGAHGGPNKKNLASQALGGRWKSQGEADVGWPRHGARYQRGVRGIRIKQGGARSEQKFSRSAQGKDNIISSAHVITSL